MVLFHYSEIPLLSLQGKFSSSETTVLLTKALRLSIRMFNNPCQGNKQDSKL